MLVEHEAEVVVGERRDRAVPGVAADEVNQDIDRPEPRDDGRDGRLGRLLLGDVGPLLQRAVAAVL